MTTIGKKLLRFIFVILAVTAITFLMINILPGDVSYIIGGETATSEDIQDIRKDLGLDRHIVVRYVAWMLSLIHI